MQICLQWLVFALLVLQYILHDPITEAFDLVDDGSTPDISPLVAGHEVMRVILLALIALHIVAALCLFIVKDGLIQRMRGGDPV